MTTFTNLWYKGIFGILSENNGALWILFVGIALSAVCAYLMGSLNFGVIISRMAYRDDVRTHGSGNGGMTNMLRTYGKGAAVLTFACDAAKAVISILLIGRMLAGVWGADIAGLACIIGHAFPIYFGFRGGKGVVTAAMMVLCQNPIVFAILLIVFIIIVSTTKYVSLASCMSVIIYPYVLYNISGPGMGVIVALLAAAVVVFLHRENIKRLRAGKENKISFSKKKKDKAQVSTADAQSTAEPDKIEAKSDAEN